MSIASNVAHVALVGIGATLVLDAWLLALQRLGVPTSNFALVGRWVAGMPRGRFTHAAISKACDELAIRCTDLLPAFEGQKTDALWVHSVDLHPNEKAHALIASGLLPWVKRELDEFSSVPTAR